MRFTASDSLRPAGITTSCRRWSVTFWYRRCVHDSSDSSGAAVLALKRRKIDSSGTENLTLKSCTLSVQAKPHQVKSTVVDSDTGKSVPSKCAQPLYCLTAFLLPMLGACLVAQSQTSGLRDNVAQCAHKLWLLVHATGDAGDCKHRGAHRAVYRHPRSAWRGTAGATHTLGRILLSITRQGPACM